MRTLRPSLLAALAALTAASLQSCTGVGGLKARFSPLDDAQEAIAQMKIARSKLTIHGSVDRRDRTYRKGEKIQLKVDVNKPAYVAILEVLADGETTLLFPNKAHPKALLPANAAVAIPGKGDKFAIVAAHAGNVLIEFVASTSDHSWLFHWPPSGSSDFGDLGSATHLLAMDIARTVQRAAAAAISDQVIHVKED